LRATIKLAATMLVSGTHAFFLQYSSKNWMARNTTDGLHVISFTTRKTQWTQMRRAAALAGGSCSM
jgi:hypothetical protein